MKKRKELVESVENVERFKADTDVGLTTEQVELRMSQGLYNKPVESPSKTTREIIAENTFTYFNFLFVVLAGFLIAVGCWRDLSFIPIIMANSLIGIVQEMKSKKVLERLTVLNAPVTTVIRNGEQITVPSKELVLDDIAVFSAGNQISADARVISGNASVNESLLTGEADEIAKKPGDKLMSGSYIVSGSCHARLEKVGKDSYISKLTLQAKRSKKGEQSEMIRSLNRIVKLAGIIIIPIGGLMFWQQYIYYDMPFKDSIRSMVAAVIGMIPEGLFLIASTTMAVSAMRLAYQKVLIHDMKCIETLARVDVLCVDKTGTITENAMQVHSVVPANESITEDDIKGLISDFAAAQSADNETMRAVKNYFKRPAGQNVLSHSGFSSEFKYSSVVFESGAYVLGAPEFVLRDEFDRYRNTIENNSRKGYRVLAFGKYNGRPDGKALSEPVTPVCFIILTNPIRKDAPDTFRYFAEQGVAIKVISGDNPVTVSEVAKQAGIKHAADYVDASTLITDDSINDAIMRYTVFGRVTPDQKRKFVQALKRNGKTVAMTGDGVNDVLALKDADCSVAMASGSDAAAQASQLVLLESDFSKMPEVVLEGRKVVNNLERSGSLFLVKNIFSLILSILTIGFGIAYPLKPSQITLISLFTIGIPGLFLSQMPNKQLIKGRFMTNVLLKALPAGITDTIIIAWMLYYGDIFGVTAADIATSSTILLSIVGLMIVYEISKPLDVYKMWLWIFCAVGLVFSMVFVSGFFDISAMSPRCVLLCINFSIVAEPCMRYLTIGLNKLRELFTKVEKMKHEKPTI